MTVEFTYSEGPYCTCLECGALVSTDEIVAGNIYDGFETARDRHEAWHESLGKMAKAEPYPDSPTSRWYDG